MVRHGENTDVIRPDRIDQTVGEPAENLLAGSFPGDPWRGLGMSEDKPDRSTNFQSEMARGHGILERVALPGLEKFGSRLRMEVPAIQPGRGVPSSHLHRGFP